MPIYLIIVLAITIAASIYEKWKQLFKTPPDKTAWGSLVLLIVASIFSAASAISDDSDKKELNGNIGDLKTENEKLQNKIDKLSNKNDSLKSNVDSTKNILTAKTFEFSGLSTELKYSRKQSALLEEQKMFLTKELNSPVVTANSYVDSITYNVTSQKYALWVSYRNTGKGKAEHPMSRFALFDANTFKITSITTSTYDDTMSILDEDVTYTKGYLLPKKEYVNQEYALFHIIYKSRFGQKYEYMSVYLFDTSYVGKPVPVLRRDITDRVKAIYNIEKHNHPFR